MYDDEEKAALIDDLMSLSGQIRDAINRIRDKDVHPLTVLLKVEFLAEEIQDIVRQAEIDFLD